MNIENDRYHHVVALCLGKESDLTDVGCVSLVPVICFHRTVMAMS